MSMDDRERQHGECMLTDAFLDLIAVGELTYLVDIKHAFRDSIRAQPAIDP